MQENTVSEDTGTPASSHLDSDLGRELTAQFRDLLNSIDKDIKDTKPTTLLIVFALGVLIGRLR